jgi:hypothetical protein
MNFDKLSTTE